MNVHRRKFLSGAALVPVAAGAAARTIVPEELTELRAQEASQTQPSCQWYRQGWKESTQPAHNRPNHRNIEQLRQSLLL